MAAGYNVTRVLAAGTTNATLVRAKPAAVNGWYLYNSAAYAVFLKLYDSATIPTAGAGTPVITIGVPAGAAANVDFGTSPENGVAFANGIGLTITKLVADNDTTVLVANDIVVNLFWS